MNNAAIEAEDSALFRDAVKGTQTLANDTIEPLPAKDKVKRKQQQAKAHPEAQTSRAASDFFSDEFKGYIEDGTVKYVAEGESHYLLKQLRRGDYVPDMLLDLHGLTLAAAKQELAAMLKACEQQLIECCCIMHGHGSGKLKQQVPHWLIQYPRLRAFHQAPKEWGGDAAIIVLLQRDD
ncbi:MAG: endonuclease SmrB [Idiomarina sp.]|nr:endonuclease SmrB [Idiomarina sp.]